MSHITLFPLVGYIKVYSYFYFYMMIPCALQNHPGTDPVWHPLFDIGGHIVTLRSHPYYSVHTVK